MKVTYFGEVAELTNMTSEDVILEHNALSDLISHLKSKYNLQMEDIHIAVNHNLVSKDGELDLKDDDEIAILSPFAGG